MTRFFTSWFFLLAVVVQLSAIVPQNLLTLDVSKPLHPSSFEYVDQKGYWNETYNDTDYGFIDFNHFSFSHLIGGPGSSYGGYYWDGFTVSISGDSANHKENGSQGWIDSQWGCMPGGGIVTDHLGRVLKDESGVVLAEKGIPYLLGYWGYFTEASGTHSLQTVFNDGESYKAYGVYVANSPWPYYGNMYGDGFARKLDREGDYFKLIIHGLDDELKPSGRMVEHYLARFENGVLNQSRNWEWVDLSELGEVAGMYYTMETSDADPIYGPNTAVYFCMDKLQVLRPSDVSITLNAVSQKMVLVNKETNDTLETGAMQSGYTYHFSAYPGVYELNAYASNGTTKNGSVELIITSDTLQDFRICTVTTGATNSGWVLNEDYTVHYQVKSPDGANRTSVMGASTTNNRATFLVLNGDSYSLELRPSVAREAAGFMSFEASGTVTSTVSRTGALPMGYDFEVSVPEGASLFLGKKNAHFQRFSEVLPVSVTQEDGKKLSLFRLAGSQSYNYRVSQPGKLTCAGVFTMTSTLLPLEITAEMMEGDPTFIERDVQANSKYNVADLFLNVNEKGHLKLQPGETHQLVGIRSWQTVDNIFSNYFIEPDFRYWVVNENGELDNSVVTVSAEGLVNAVASGTAIVLVSYDAIRVASAVGGPLFGALWPENTGVFVVSVADGDADVQSSMLVNDKRNASNVSSKLSGTFVDAELDVFYYLAEEGGYSYSFTASGVSAVHVARPLLEANGLQYAGFDTTGVLENGDGSYTVRLSEGANIVRLTGEHSFEYQVLRAKPVQYSVTNTTTPGEIFYPGDQVEVKFNTVYHPVNKLAGVYNMAARIRYSVDDAVVEGASNQYTFAASAQTISAVIPANWDVSSDFTFTNGAIFVSGFGDPYGGHRSITLEQGKNPNFSAQMRTAYLGVLPDISIPVQQSITTAHAAVQHKTVRVYPNPFVDYLIVSVPTEQVIRILDFTGHELMSVTVALGETRLDVSSLPKGVYIMEGRGWSQKVVR